MGGIEARSVAAREGGASGVQGRHAVNYYNEIDLYAAQWLRNLIAAGHIAPGIVDTRSIEDVQPSDLRGFRQCHFFAGIGVWSYALRRAGWADDRPIWTGSCPCQPFSTAGKGAGFADERHLWPAFYHLIEQCRPATVVGEQVASKDADTWIDLVHTDLEALGYAFGAIPFPSAGVGAPHIRDRLYWVVDASDTRLERFGSGHQATERRDGAIRHAAEAGEFSGLDNPRQNHDASQVNTADHGQAQANRPANQPGGSGVSLGGVANTDCHERAAPVAGITRETPGIQRSDRSAELSAGQLAGTGNALCQGPGPTNGLWRAADWLLCRDGKWRPVEPGTFPLAHGASARVGRLRAYGNAINAQAAEVFIRSYLDATNG
jgi:DNA (cytosine-5)-methyltransferase 1